MKLYIPEFYDKRCFKRGEDNIMFLKITKKRKSSNREHTRKVKNRPSYENLIREIEELGYSGTGRKYGVSDNAVKKWVQSYGIVKATLSQASGTPEEGATTSGEVKSS